MGDTLSQEEIEDVYKRQGSYRVKGIHTAGP